MLGELDGKIADSVRAAAGTTDASPGNAAMLEGRHSSDWRCASALILALGISLGCSQSVAPAALLDMRGLPDDAQRRNERLDSAAARPAPETRRRMNAKVRRVETAAATAAAVLGMLFSSSPNVLLGGGSSFDENQISSPQESRTARGKKSPDQDDPEPVDASQLVPWVKLGPDAAK
jgi:hypothetical protein